MVTFYRAGCSKKVKGRPVIQLFHPNWTLSVRRCDGGRRSLCIRLVTGSDGWHSCFLRNKYTSCSWAVDSLGRSELRHPNATGVFEFNTRQSESWTQREFHPVLWVHSAKVPYLCVRFRVVAGPQNTLVWEQRCLVLLETHADILESEGKKRDFAWKPERILIVSDLNKDRSPCQKLVSCALFCSSPVTWYVYRHFLDSTTIDLHRH